MAEELSAATALSDVDLQAGFGAFVAAAQRLEQSYAELRHRAAAIDLELAATNARLASTLRERETVLAALPVGVVRVGSGGAGSSWSNPEADRLLDVATAAGVDLLATDACAGDVELGSTTVRVVRADLDDGGEVVVLEDRSGIVQLESEVRRLDRLAGLSELALGVAHEIKNPLNGVLGFASLMRRSDDVHELHDYADRVCDGVGRVDAIVRAMLAFARPASGVAAVPRRLGDVVRAAAVAVGLDARHVTVGGSADPWIDGVVGERVLTNLLTNSREAAVGHDVSVCVEVSVSDGRVVLLVRDDGPGVPAALRDTLFEPFTTSKASGHGLGLAIVARVLDYLGGRIELCDPDLAGAAFRVELPACAEPRRTEVEA